MSFEKYKIETGINFPKLSRPKRWADLIIKMKVGDSIFFETRNEAISFRNAFYNSKIKCGLRVDRKGFRVWRLS